jgi:hypothetical protein
MSERRLIGFNEESGVTKTLHDHADGTWAVEVSQDLTPALDRNKELQNSGMPSNQWGGDLDVRWVAFVPFTVMMQWQELYGIDYYDPDPAVQARIDKLLSSNEWRHLRTMYTGRLA